jgi:large subunit ribosomal protein L9
MSSWRTKGRRGNAGIPPRALRTVSIPGFLDPGAAVRVTSGRMPSDRADKRRRMRYDARLEPLLIDEDKGAIMQLLLLKDVRKLGHIGDVVEVKTGYARNYLLPQRLATEPTEANLKAIESAKLAAAAERARKLKEFESLAAQMMDVTVTIEAAANPEGTLYGSVAAKDVAAALQALGYPVRSEHVLLEVPIRTLDNRSIRIEFTDEVSTQIKLWVVREGAVEDVEQRAEGAEEHPAQDEGDESDDAD